MFIVLSPLSILVNLPTVYLFIKRKSTRKFPGDIILGLSITEIMVSIVFLIESIHAKIT